MSTTMTTARRVRPGTVALWVLQVLLAASFVMAGLPKLSGDPVMTEMFAAIGAGQWLRYVVGVLELAGAIGLLIPRLSGAAALGLVGIMVGAVVTNVAALGVPPVVPSVYLLLAATIAWFRRPSPGRYVRDTPGLVASRHAGADRGGRAGDGGGDS
ncbi:DoxX family protein [Kribbella sp. NPDC056345]|uniref:DoxX family protein n=1 Tax=Kribbella sp. NPDC056345 TaxID=3345789 RepID=UPI0035DF1769